MPIPSPSGEDQSAFISRCMGDSVMRKEFPDQKQRSAVCYSKWRKKESFKPVFYKRPIIQEELDIAGEKKLYIVGNAVETGISRNKVDYTPEELQTAAKTLIGKPILLNHDDTDVRNIVGRVIDARYENGGVPFKAEIDTEELAIVSKIRKGFINSVSIGAEYDDIYTDESGIKHPSGLRFVELSLIPIPGVSNATISQVIEERYELKKMEDEKMELEEISRQNEELRKQMEDMKKCNEKFMADIQAKETSKAQETAKIEEVSATKKLEEKLRELEKKLEERRGLVDAPKIEKTKPKFDMVFEKSEGNNKLLDFYPKNYKELY